MMAKVQRRETFRIRTSIFCWRVLRKLEARGEDRARDDWAREDADEHVDEIDRERMRPDGSRDPANRRRMTQGPERTAAGLDDFSWFPVGKMRRRRSGLRSGLDLGAQGGRSGLSCAGRFD